MSEKRHVIRRGLRFERWRVVTYWKWFYGLGSPRFEFEFRFGRPGPVKQPEWIVYGDVPHELAAPLIAEAKDALRRVAPPPTEENK